MMNFSQQIKLAHTDEWYTKAESVNIIVPFLLQRGYKKILCPFDKEQSNFVKVLAEKGFSVGYSHIETGTDFFSIGNMKEYDAVVSNPPFSKREKILEKLFSEGVPFAMIMDFNGLFDSFSRWELFKKNDFELIIPKGRMQFFNENCEGKSPHFQSVYVCKGITGKQIVFTDQSKENKTKGE